jgi:hypothetical protein
MDNEQNQLEPDAFALITSSSVTIKTSKSAIENLIASKSSRITLKVVKSKSEVWSNFCRVTLDGKSADFVSCNKCKAILTHSSKSGTNGMRNHRCMRISEGEEPPSKQRCIDHLMQRKLPPTAKSSIADAAALFVAKNLRPFTVVSGEGFRELAAALINIGANFGSINPTEVLPSNKTVARHATTQYQSLKAAVIEELATVNAVGVTCDHWEHESTKTPYLTVTAQYLKDGATFARVLQTRKAEAKTSAATLRETTAVLKEFCLSGKSLTFVTDSAPSMPAAFGRQAWLGCAAHNINLAQKHSFEAPGRNSSSADVKGWDLVEPVCDMLQHAKDLVTLSKRSIFHRLLNTKLNQCIEVRWDSRHEMLASIEANYEPLEAQSVTYEKVSQHLAFIPRSLLVNLLALLKPLKNARLTLCKENAATLHLVLPQKKNLLQFYAPKKEDEEWCAEIKRWISANIEKYMAVVMPHKMATILVPMLRGMKNFATATKRQTIITELTRLVSEVAHSKPTQQDKATSANAADPVDDCLLPTTHRANPAPHALQKMKFKIIFLPPCTRDALG